MCSDVGMIFWDQVGVEILTTLFGTSHPSFYAANHEAFIYEQLWMSQAYILWDRGDFYYIETFFGELVAEMQ